MAVSLRAIATSLFYLGLFNGGHSLQLTELKVPRHANFGETVTLECLFELGRGSLYSVKWYKDDDEFFRYMPDSAPAARVFPLPGVRLLVEGSNMSQVILRHVDYSSSGTYRCEVSTEAPDFETTLQNKNMTVVAYPDGPPQISGARNVYSSADELIIANCTSGRSNPPPHISWYVNGIKAKNYYTVEGPTVEYDGLLYSSSLGLRYPLSRLDSGRVYLNCSSSVAAMAPISSVFVARVSSASAEPAKQRLHNHGLHLSPWPLLLIFALLS